MVIKFSILTCKTFCIVKHGLNPLYYWSTWSGIVAWWKFKKMPKQRIQWLILALSQPYKYAKVTSFFPCLFLVDSANPILFLFLLSEGTIMENKFSHCSCCIRIYFSNNIRKCCDKQYSLSYQAMRQEAKVRKNNVSSFVDVQSTTLTFKATEYKMISIINCWSYSKKTF